MTLLPQSLQIDVLNSQGPNHVWHLYTAWARTTGRCLPPRSFTQLQQMLQPQSTTCMAAAPCLLLKGQCALLHFLTYSLQIDVLNSQGPNHMWHLYTRLGKDH